jgi:hypothetical protein
MKSSFMKKVIISRIQQCSCLYGMDSSSTKKRSKNKDEENKEKENSESKTNPRRYAKRENGTMCVNRLYGND